MPELLRSVEPIKTAPSIAARLRGIVTARTVEKWLARETIPSAPALLGLLAAYGPQVGLACFPKGAPDWLLQAALNARRADYERARDALEEQLRGL